MIHVWFTSFVLLALSFVTITNAQVGIGTNAPSSSAKLEVSSTTKGFLPPRMTYAQRNAITSPAKGLIIYCIDCGGCNGEAQLYNGFQWVNMLGGEASYAQATTTYTVGQSAQGGIIAYIFQQGDPGYDPNCQHGLVAAPTDLNNNGQRIEIQWGCLGVDLTGANGSALLTGKRNTDDIVSQISLCSSQNIAAKLCADYTNGGYSDWFLPSAVELDKLHINRVIIGQQTAQNPFGFADGSGNSSSLWYWASTETDANAAWAMWFGVGASGPIDKPDTRAVRPIRYF